MTAELHYREINENSDGLGSGEFTSAEVTQAVPERIENANPIIKSYVLCQQRV